MSWPCLCYADSVGSKKSHRDSSQDLMCSIVRYWSTPWIRKAGQSLESLRSCTTERTLNRVYVVHLAVSRIVVLQTMQMLP